MHNLDDNELDRLSRDAAEGYEPEAAPPAWESLQKRLDREMPTRKEGKDRKYWLLLLLLFLVGGGSALYYFSGDHNLETGKAALVTHPSGNATSENEGASKSKAGESADDPSSNTKVAISDSKPANADAASETTSATRDRNAKATGEGSRGLKGVQARNNAESFSGAKQPPFNKDRSNQLTGGKSGKGNNARTAAGSGSVIAANDAGNQSGEPDGKVSTENSFYHISGLNGEAKDFRFAKLNEANPKLKGSDPVAYTKTTKDKKATENQFRPFEIGIIIGPDKSQVHGTKDDQAGYNLGFSLAFNPSSRWQINTGLIYNKKYYSAKGEDYHAPKGYWTDTVYLSMVNGNCLMWDLPINVRYNIMAKKNHSVFASAGISSYFMKKEDYGYHYYYYTGQYGYRYKSTPTNDAYWFSVGNLSAGYEQNFGSFSVQAEPYVKFALRGVGLGSVDLNSYGMNIGLKYKPNWPRKKANPQTK